jgi:hypothetical protein
LQKKHGLLHWGNAEFATADGAGGRGMEQVSL